MIIERLTNQSLLKLSTAIILATSFTPSGVNVGQGNVVYAEEEDWQPVVKEQDIECLPEDKDVVDREKGANSKPSSGENVDGDVFKEGSEAHKVAQQIYDIATEEYGFSGAFAIGMLANVHFESGYIPNRAETARGHSGIKTFDMNSKKPPVGAGGSLDGNTTHFGGGLFQFTHYTKFTDSDSWGKVKPDGWAVENQMHFMFENAVSEFTGANPYVITALKDAARNAARNPQGLKPFDTVADFVSTDDYERATWAFQSGYERPANFDQQRVDLAKKLADTFDKDKKKADKDKIKKVLGSSSDSSSDSSSATKGTDTDSQEYLDACSPGKTKKAKFDWLEDGTGEHGLSVSNSAPFLIRPKEIEKGGKYEHLAKYFLDPAKLGMEWQKGGLKNGWAPNIGNPLGNQCVDLSAALAGNIWWKDGKRSLEMLNSNPHGTGTGNGDSTAYNLGAAYAGKSGSLTMSDKGISKEPSKGAIFSVGGGEYGHTGIVSHVFENGDIAVTEMNMTGYSGEGSGTANDWNFSIYSKSEIESRGFFYFDPSEYGYEPNPDALKK